DAIADIDSDMGRRGALLDLDDLTLELIARAQLLHSVLLPRIRSYGTMPPLLRSPSAIVLHRLACNEKHLNCLFDGAASPYCGSAGAAKPCFASTRWPSIDRMNMASS